MSQSTLSLADRMKQYEGVTSISLMRKTPVIIRIDGKSFKNYTKNFKKPHDMELSAIMGSTLKHLVDNIQNAVFGYTQSDEISILLRDWDSEETDAWFGYNVQKLASVSASLTTAFFNQLAKNVREDLPLAVFDSRVFNIPQNEVINYMIWRQRDGIRNSIRNHAHYYLGHAACQGVSNNDILGMMLNMDSPFDWNNDLPIYARRGIAYSKDASDIDDAIPVFEHCREYVERHLFVQREEPENYPQI